MLHHVVSCFTIYTTSRQIQIKSTLLALTYLTLIITVWVAYLTSINLSLKNIYQRSCDVEASATTKVKGGIDAENIPRSEFQIQDDFLYRRVFDSSDLIFPPFGDLDGTFIAVTNMIINPNQTRGKCPESNKTLEAFCAKDEDCVKGYTSVHLSGTMTGKCVHETSSCEVSAWCPVESDTLPLKGNRPLFEGVTDFTLMIKSNVEFPKCGKDLHYRNILDNFTDNYLSNCINNPKTDPLCPIFKLGNIVEWSGQNFSQMAVLGGVIKIELQWQCDFDWYTSNFCFPKYTFERVDDPNATVSPGINFRTSYYHEENRRSLTKMYGIKFLIVTTGEGKKFDFLQLILALGATIAFFDIAPLVCDIMFHMLCYLKRFKIFQKHFGDFSAKARYVDSRTLTPRIVVTKDEKMTTHM